MNTVETFIDYTTEKGETCTGSVHIDYTETEEGKEIVAVLLSEWIASRDLRHVDGLTRLFFHQEGILCSFDNVHKKPLTLFASQREAREEVLRLNKQTSMDWNGLKRYTVENFSEV